MWTAKRKTIVAVALCALLTWPVVSSALGLANEPLIVAASAPKASSGMTLFVVSDGGLLDKVRDPRAEYAIYYGDRLIYPPGGKGATFDVVDRKGTIFIPYSQFVVGNGEYDVVVRYQGVDTRVRVSVHKWAEYVFLHPFDKGNFIEVEVALSSATGGDPNDRVLAEGEIVLELRYRGQDGKEDRALGLVTATTHNDRTSTVVTLPKSRFNAGPGYYSFEPLFHNSEARNNVQVGPDPTMAHRDPPWNWIHVK